MTRRQGIIAMLASIIGIQTHRAAVAADRGLVGPPVTGRANVFQQPAPFVGTLTFELRAFTKYRFSLDGEMIELTPDEVFAALKAAP